MTWTLRSGGPSWNIRRVRAATSTTRNVPRGPPRTVRGPFEQSARRSARRPEPFHPLLQSVPGPSCHAFSARLPSPSGRRRQLLAAPTTQARRGSSPSDPRHQSMTGRNAPDATPWRSAQMILGAHANSEDIEQGATGSATAYCEIVRDRPDSSQEEARDAGSDQLVFTHRVSSTRRSPQACGRARDIPSQPVSIARNSASRPRGLLGTRRVLVEPGSATDQGHHSTRPAAAPASEASACVS